MGTAYVDMPLRTLGCIDPKLPSDAKVTSVASNSIFGPSRFFISSACYGDDQELTFKVLHKV